MTEPVAAHSHELIDLTTAIVAAYIQHNALNAGDVPKLIADVYAALNGLSDPAPVAVADAPKPAVSVRKSITPDYLICLEDGKKFKSLKRHLHTAYNLSPEEYREKWGLASDYPMVAPNYSATRSALAKSNGLGHNVAAQPAKKQRKVLARAA